MLIDIFQLVITVISILLFLRVYWIQASSNSLISMMNMQKKEALNEIEIGNNNIELDRKVIIKTFSYLNLVSKLYLNHCININMLRTFEGVMIKLLNNKKAKSIYREIYYEFLNNIKTAEPPFINLIYTTDILVTLNKILNKRNLFSPFYPWGYLAYKKVYFSIWSTSKSNWNLAENVFNTL